jgi:enamine deaminase RidA (YjgF/YER057c/UK114 family)
MAIQAARMMIACLATAVVFAAFTTPAMAKQCYAPDQRAQERGFSRIVTTEGGKVLWLAGQTGAPNATFDEQVRGIFAELDKNIKAVGGSGLADMVTMTIFITDTRLGDRFAQLRRETFRECFPASSLITVTGLAQPGLLIEVEGTAVVGGR